MLKLPLTEYIFHYQAQQQITFPEYSGTLWHGVLGKALKDQYCYTPNSPCQGCLFANQCGYIQLFKNIALQNNDFIRLYQSIPAPHIIRVRSERYIIKPFQSFEINIILIADTNQYLNKLIIAMQKVGLNGFGKNRKKANLKQVSQKTDLWQSSNSTNNKIRIQFITLFKPNGKMLKTKEFKLNLWVMGLIRRISLLYYFYTSKKLRVDFIDLKKQTQNIPILAQALEWKYHFNLANRTNQHQQNTGWLGWIEINLQDYPDLIPYLLLGQWLNTGKNASMGFGQYQLIEID